MTRKDGSKKYEGKSKPARIFHKYTGIIMLSLAGIVILIAWNYMESEEYYFEDYSCPEIIQLYDEEMTPHEYLTYDKIVKECISEEFTPPT